MYGRRKSNMLLYDSTASKKLQANQLSAACLFFDNVRSNRETVESIIEQMEKDEKQLSLFDEVEKNLSCVDSVKTVFNMESKEAFFEHFSTKSDTSIQEEFVPNNQAGLMVCEIEEITPEEQLVYEKWNLRLLEGNQGDIQIEETHSLPNHQEEWVETTVLQPNSELESKLEKLTLESLNDGTWIEKIQGKTQIEKTHILPNHQEEWVETTVLQPNPEFESKLEKLTLESIKDGTWVKKAQIEKSQRETQILANRQSGIAQNVVNVLYKIFDAVITNILAYTVRSIKNGYKNMKNAVCRMYPSAKLFFKILDVFGNVLKSIKLDHNNPQLRYVPVAIIKCDISYLQDVLRKYGKLLKEKCPAIDNKHTLMYA